MVGQAIVTAFQIYGISIIIAMLVAVLIKVMVTVTGKIEQSRVAVEVPQGEVCPVLLGIPDEDVAALSAAIFTVMGPHRILHISERNRAWASQGRAAQHSSHAGHPRPQH
ncbi:MAG: hypothetical protein JZU64_02995 [Rhodoferax sp.]|jgi:hypothetical protein|nr:hypothetical protein [Rhodoferax sp.]